jgi:hypothetical protein
MMLELERCVGGISSNEYSPGSDNPQEEDRVVDLRMQVNGRKRSKVGIK